MKKLEIKQRDDIIEAHRFMDGQQFEDFLKENTKKESNKPDNPYQKVYSRPEPKTKPPTSRPQHPCPECGKEMKK